MLTTSPELVFHSAGVKKLICRRTRTQSFAQSCASAPLACREFESWVAPEAPRGTVSSNGGLIRYTGFSNRS
ncbi:MAG: hypothetical protein RL417_356 [Pseudomonadota bacterium]